MPPKAHRKAKRSHEKKKKRSQYAGVHWHGRARKWVAQISIKCVRTHLGYFENDLEAAKKYDEMARYLNDGRILNFPDEEEAESDVDEDREEIPERLTKRQKSSSVLEILSDMAVLQSETVEAKYPAVLESR